MSDFDQDKSTDDAWLDELYRSTQDESTPESLDRTVLEMAAKKHTDTRAWIRWSAPLATAAVVLVSVSVFFNQPAPTSEAPAAVQYDLQERALDAQAEFDIEQAGKPTSVISNRASTAEMPAAEAPAPTAQFAAPLRAKAVREEAEQIEEVVVTGARIKRSEADMPASIMLDDSSDLMLFSQSCSDAFVPPEGAELMNQDAPAQGETIRFRHSGGVFTAQCVQGRWQITPEENQ